MFVWRKGKYFMKANIVWCRTRRDFASFIIVKQWRERGKWTMQWSHNELTLYRKKLKGAMRFEADYFSVI